MAAVLGYWNIAGYAESIRLLLEYVGAPYADKRFNYGPPDETMREEWYREKSSLNLAFPNLPYFIDGDVRLTQSIAILRYVARKHNLISSSESDQIRTDLAEQQAADLCQDLVSVAYAPNLRLEQEKVKYLAALPDKLRAYDAFLGSQYDWFGGSRISLADFMMFVFLHWHRLLDKHAIDKFEHLKTFMERFEALPRVSEYVKSEKFKKVPVFSPMANWGNETIDYNLS